MRLTRSKIAVMLVIAGAGLAQAQQPGGPPNGPPPGGQMGQPGEMRRMGQPGPRMRGMGRGGPGMRGRGMGGAGMRRMTGAGQGLAAMLLSHTAELKLTDQQVTRLAAISRRTEERHRAMRASMDSLMRANRPATRGVMPGTPLPRGSEDQMRATMTRMRDQERADIRDALAVLTVEQQADAWMMKRR